MPVTVFIHRRVLYCLQYCSEGELPCSHDTQVLRKWIEAISKELKVNLQCTQSMMHWVWKHTKRVVYKFKKLRHGWQQENGKLSYKHQTSEDLALEERSHVVEEENTKVNSELKKSEQKLKQQVSNLSNQVRKIVASGYQPFHDQHGRGPCENRKKTVAIHWHGLKPKDTRLQRWRAFYNKSMRLCWSAIQRVQNQWLWMKYFSSKLRLQYKNKGFDFQFSKPRESLGYRCVFHWNSRVFGTIHPFDRTTKCRSKF